MGMIDKAAEVIAREARYFGEQLDNPREVARAVIESLRIPQSELIYWVDGRPNASPQDVDWNARIDAILKD
jgi:hypothetical protein